MVSPFLVYRHWFNLGASLFSLSPPSPPSIHFFTQWYNDGLPSDFWLPGFFFTQSFLTGALQNYARKYKLPIDTLEFDYFISNRVGEKNHHNDVVAKPDDGVIVWGCVGPRMYHCFVASLMLTLFYFYLFLLHTDCFWTVLRLILTTTCSWTQNQKNCLARVLPFGSNLSKVRCCRYVNNIATLFVRWDHIANKIVAHSCFLYFFG